MADGNNLESKGDIPYWKQLNILGENSPIPSEQRVIDGLNSSDPIVRMGIVKMNNLYLSKEQVDKLLTDSEWQIRCAVIRKTDLYFTEEQIELVFNDPSVHVRIEAFKRYESHINKSHVDAGLEDISPEIRAFFFSFPRTENIPYLTSEQISSGLDDVSTLVRRAASSYSRGRLTLLNNRKVKASLFPKDADKALKDSDIEVVRNIILNLEVTLNTKQVESLLNHDNPLIREAIATRALSAPFYHLSTEQIKNGLDDNDVSVRRVFAGKISTYYRNSGAKCSEREKSLLVCQALTDDNPIIRLATLRDAGIGLEDGQIKNCLKDPDAKVRLAALNIYIENDLVWRLSDDEIEAALTDPDPLIREKLPYEYDRLSKDELSFNRKQLDRGLEDIDPTVRECFFRVIGTQLTKDEIEKGLTDESERIRSYCATINSDELTSDQIRRGLNDKSSLVRWAFVELGGVILSSSVAVEDIKLETKKFDESRIVVETKNFDESRIVVETKNFDESRIVVETKSFDESRIVVETNAFDESEIVAETIVETGNVQLVDSGLGRSLISSYLLDPNPSFRAKVYSLKDVNFTNEQIRKGLNDECIVAEAIIHNENIQFSKRQVANALNHSHFLIRRAVLSREDIPLTETQVEEGLTCTNKLVRRDFYTCKRVNLNDKQRARLIDDVYLDEHDKAAIIDLPDTKLTEKQVAKLISDRSSFVIASLARNKSYTPNQEQIGIFLDNEDPEVVLAVLNRDDISLTPEQTDKYSPFKNYEMQAMENRRTYRIR